MSNRTLERALDRALSDHKVSVDPAVSDLVSLAGNLSSSFDPEVPDSRRERALFLNAVAQRSHPWGVVRNLVTAAAGAALVVALGFAGRSAAPGDVLYPVRQVLGSVGLATPVDDEIGQNIANARSLLEQAEADLADDPEDALAAVFSAMFELGGAEALLDDYDGGNPGQFVSDIARLRAQALALLRAIDLDSAGIDLKGLGLGRGDGGPSSNQGRGPVDDPHPDRGEDRGGDNRGRGSDGKRQGKGGENENQNQGGSPGTDNGNGGTLGEENPSPSPSPSEGPNSGPGQGQGQGQGQGHGQDKKDDGEGPGNGGGNGGGSGGGGGNDGKPDDGTDGLDLDLPGNGNGNGNGIPARTRAGPTRTSSTAT